jgi:peptidoglycan/xylan/chitin deacetylase (PgdA/CDA1 family)
MNSRQALLNLAQLLGVRALYKRKNKFAQRVLMYHRVVDSPSVSGIAPDEFYQQMLYIKKNYRLVGLNEIVHSIKLNQPISYSVALTFDDGHSDFYENAWPILKELDVPATLFVTTGFVDGDTWLWPDLLNYLVRQTKKRILQLDNLGRLEVAEKPYESWRLLANYCVRLNSLERTGFISSLSGLLFVKIPKAPVNPYNPLTWGQIREMQSEGLDVGNHTVTHPILSAESEESIVREIDEASKRIFEMTGNQPQGVCYPNGMPEDVNELVINAVKNGGHEYGLMACSDHGMPGGIFSIDRLAATNKLNDFKWRLAKV